MSMYCISIVSDVCRLSRCFKDFLKS